MDRVCTHDIEAFPCLARGRGPRPRRLRERSRGRDAPPGALPGPALWQVADDDTTIYLFGTVHALPKDKPWFDSRIERAFTSADELVTEIDVASAAASAGALQSAGMLPEGQTLRGLMTPEDRPTLVAIYYVGIDGLLR